MADFHTSKIRALGVSPLRVKALRISAGIEVEKAQTGSRGTAAEVTSQLVHAAANAVTIN